MKTIMIKSAIVLFNVTMFLFKELFSSFMTMVVLFHTTINSLIPKNKDSYKRIVFYFSLISLFSASVYSIFALMSFFHIEINFPIILYIYFLYFSELSFFPKLIVFICVFISQGHLWTIGLVTQSILFAASLVLIIYYFQYYYPNIFHMIDKINAFFLLPTYYIAHITFSFLYHVVSFLIQISFCPALIYSFSKWSISNDDNTFKDVITFSWGSMLQTAHMNAKYFSSPENGLHVAFSHKYASSRQIGVKMYLDDIKEVIANNPNVNKIRFCGYFMGGSVAVQTLNAFMEDNEIDTSKIVIELILDRTFNSMSEMLGRVFTGCFPKENDWQFIYYVSIPEIVKKLKRNHKNISVSGISESWDWVYGENRLTPNALKIDADQFYVDKWTIKFGNSKSETVYPNTLMCLHCKKF